MTPRRRAILIVGLILALLIVIILVITMLLRAVAPAPAPVADPVAEPSDDVVLPPSEVDFVNPLVTAPVATPNATAGRQMAELFAERYGSYSNQGDYQNLRDLLPVMTARYRQETEAFLASAEPAAGAAFEGVTSVRVSTDIRSIDETAAVIAVALQQAKTVGNAAPVIGYRTLRMELRRVGEDWRVDRASWEN